MFFLYANDVADTRVLEIMKFHNGFIVDNVEGKKKPNQYQS